MNKNLRSLWMVVLVSALFCGCESARDVQSGVSSYGQVVNLKPEHRPTEAEILDRAVAQPVEPMPGVDAQQLLEGRSLRGWRVADFAGSGRVEVRPGVEGRPGLVFLSAGEPFTGINYTNVAPTMNYEIWLEAMRVSGSDFFCGLTFPVRDTFCSFIVGGWGGTIVGLSSIDDLDASENETTQFINFETGRWYRIRLRVTEKKIEAWVEQKKVVNLTTVGRKISLRPGDIEESKPLGLASWQTGAAFREIKIHSVTGPDSKAE